ncbi:ElyC/SanA/YdcF family protein [Zeaxanthinibacter sp. PT1]|uniref:SanA/YdcF family protein n=1 Tax=Zeaxanthinibacter TaxID=561554 RepID=UPI00234A6D89|nr:ElyC/SanA/YdcF family protein [Zeaxanthinibacter sp. PT1]MDC6350124.1 ElyC/SanA/YdcF family protein [Zeaxanthinibacter sp. PT1]
MKKRIRQILLLTILGTTLLLLLCTSVIEIATIGKTYTATASIPHNRVGLLLGTTRYQAPNKVNPFYANRIQAAIALYQAGKIDFLLVSGDNATLYYNEPNTIKKDLISGGIPAEKIFLDFAGFRTLDSMVRAKYVFGLDEVTVISQEFHNERAIFLAKVKGLDAIGYNAEGISGMGGLQVYAREYLARVKVFIDLALNTQPRFYGKRIVIE